MARVITQSNSRLVEDIFTASYVVPDFQREYVWKQKQVRALLEDIHHAHRDDDRVNYFVGSIVVYPEDDGLCLVDGQQRMTTLYLLFCAIRDRFLQLDPASDVSYLEQRIAGSSVGRGGVGVRQHRVSMQYEGDRAVLEKIGNGKAGEARVKPKEPGRPILDAYRTIMEFLEDEFAAGRRELGDFAHFLLKRVELIVVETADFLQALIIFERINYRGLGLNAVDLLKNLLFKVSGQHGYTNLARDWRSIIDTLRAGGEKNYLRFLRYFLVATYDFSKMPKADDVFTWIAANREGTGIETNPARFVKELASAATAYVNMLGGQSPDGSANEYLHGIACQKSGVRQHLPVLLAARRLSPAQFRELSCELEALALVFALTGAQWNEIEKKAPDWAKELRAIESKEQFDSFLAVCVRPKIADKLPAARERLAHTDELRKGLLKYLLARVAAHVDVQCGKDVGLDLYLERKVTIEHVLPQKFSSSLVSEGFESEEAAMALVHDVGNLTLLRQVDNSAAQNGTFDAKRATYSRSEFEFTKSLVTDLELGVNTKYGRARDKFGLMPFPVWTADSIASRKEAILKVMGDLWGL